MADRTRTRYTIELDFGGGGLWVDVSHLVEKLEVSWGTDSEAAVADVRFRTARGRMILLSDPSLDQSDVAALRIRDPATGLTAWQGRAVPSVHEPVATPDFLYWSLEGRYAPDQRVVHDYFIAPQPDVGTLDQTDLHVPVNWRTASGRTSFIVGNMTPAQLLNRLGPLCGGWVYESKRGVVGFVNAKQAFDSIPALFLTADMEPSEGTLFYLNRNTVRSETAVRGTSYIPEATNPITVGIVELDYRQYAYTPLSSFKPAPDRTLRIDQWIVPTGPPDVPIVVHGGGSRFARVREPVLGVAGQAELFYVPFIPAVGTRLDERFSIIFHANVSRLRAYDLTVAKFADAAETYGLVDADLAPWATMHMYQQIIRPYLEIRSRPLWHFALAYTEAQSGLGALSTLQSVQPGDVVHVELPDPTGGQARIRKCLILAVKLELGRDMIPKRLISGVSTDVRPVVYTFGFEAEAFGPFDGRAVVSVTDPDPTKSCYVRFRERGASAWTSVPALPQAEQTVFALGAGGLTPETTYEAQGGLESDFSDALTDLFTTDPSELAALVGSFCPEDENGDEFASGRLEGMIYWPDSRTFTCITSDDKLYTFNAAGRYVTHVPLDLPAGSAPTRMIQPQTTALPTSTALQNVTVDSGRIMVSKGSASVTYAYDQTTGQVSDRKTGRGMTRSYKFKTGQYTSIFPIGAFAADAETGRVTSMAVPKPWRRNGPLVGWTSVAAPITVFDGRTVQDAWGDRSIMASGGRPAINVNTITPPQTVDGVDIAPSFRTISDLGGIGVVPGGDLFYLLDPSTSCIYAMLRDGTEHVQHATTRLLAGITLDGVPIDGFEPRTFTYNVFLSSYFDEPSPGGDTAVGGIRFRPDDKLELEPERGLIYLDRGEKGTVSLTVSAPDGTGAQKYTVTVTDDLRRPGPPGPPAPPATVDTDIHVSPTSVAAGVDSVLSWSTATRGGVRLEATAVVDQVDSNNRVVKANVNRGALSGSLNVSFDTPGTYRWRIVATYGSVTDTEYASLTVTAKPTPPVIPVITKFSAAPPILTLGQSAVLTWTTSNATAVTLDGASVGLGGTQRVTPGLGVHTYSLVAVSSTGHRATATVGVTVVPVVITAPDRPPPTARPVPIPAVQTSLAPAVTATLAGVPWTVGATLTVTAGQPARLRINPQALARWAVYSWDPKTLKRTTLAESPATTVQLNPTGPQTIQIVGWDKDDKRHIFRFNLNTRPAATVTPTPTPVPPPTPDPDPVDVAVPQPGGSLRVGSDDILETGSVVLTYLAWNAETATLATSDGPRTFRADTNGRIGGSYTDTPKTSGRVTYTWTVVGAAGSTPARIRTPVNVTALPTISDVTFTPATPPYSGRSVARITTDADEVNVYDLAGGALLRRLAVAAGIAVIAYDLFGGGPKSQGGIQVRPSLIGTHPVPALASLAASASLAWDYGTLRRSLEKALPDEDFIEPVVRALPSGFTSDILYVAKNAYNVVLAEGASIAYRSVENAARAASLATATLPQIVNDPLVREAVTLTFVAGGAYGSIITGRSLFGASNLILSCQLACAYRLAGLSLKVGSATSLQLAVSNAVTRVVGLIVQQNAYAMSVREGITLTTWMGSAATAVRTLTGGPVSALASVVVGFASYLADRRLSLNAAALVSAVQIIDNLMNFVGATQFPSQFGGNVAWTRPDLDFTWDPARPRKFSPNATLRMFGETWSVGLQVNEVDYGDGDVAKTPFIVFKTARDARFDGLMADVVQFLETRLSGPRLGALGQAELIARR